MFTDEDYKNYFNELETIFKKTLTVYTDLVNELSDEPVRSKLHPIMTDCLETFKTIKKYKEKFSSKT